MNPLPVGETQPFTATATLSDGSTADYTSTATWNTSDSSVVTIDATGVAVTRATNTADISATYAVTSNTVTMEVDADLPPTQTDPEDYTPENVCDAEFCLSDETLSATCDTFLENCLAVNPDANSDECVGGALFICQNPDADPGTVCDYEACGQDPALQQECLDFMAWCMPQSLSGEECVGAMLFKCGLEE